MAVLSRDWSKDESKDTSEKMHEIGQMPADCGTDQDGRSRGGEVLILDSSHEIS